MTATRYFEAKLKKSGVGQPGAQRRVLEGLGLRRFGKTVYLKDTPAVRGMLYKVVHLVEVTPREGTPPASARARARQQQAR